MLPTVNFKIAPQMSGFLSNFCSVERFFVDVLQRKLANNKRTVTSKSRSCREKNQLFLERKLGYFSPKKHPEVG
jgi:hypothetical protein